MKKHLRYLKYLIRHRWYVFLECCKLGIPWRGIVHNLSKFLPSEWFPYVERFYGNDREGYSFLREVRCTDTVLKQATLDKAAPYGFDEGGIQFVDFVTNIGTFQLAVYNSHNGYYGHGIIVAKDDDILLDDTL